MLTPNEREGCSLILENLTQGELISLKDTITKRQIAVESRQEAVKAILEYSQSAVELLRRKKLRRDLIFQYLAKCRVIVPVSTEKHELIQKTLQHWGSTLPADTDLRDIDSRASLAESTTQTATTVAAQLPGASVAVRETAADNNSKAPAHKHQALGETFVRWFYELMNSQNPVHTGPRGDFGPHHFWENCTLKLVSKTPDVCEEAFEGHVLVARRLQALPREELLVFNPNVDEDGVKVQSDPHGLVIVQACGTIHQHDRCLGVFQQMFGLVRCPQGDNWKVKTSQLQLCSSEVTAIPRLRDSNTSELLAVHGAMAVVPHV